MAANRSVPSRVVEGPGLQKAPTGIHGLDEVTNGGLPRGRPTLVCGAAGCGKTMLAAEFLVRGAVQYGEPGVFMMFEESAGELTENVRSLGFDLEKLQKQRKSHSTSSTSNAARSRKRANTTWRGFLFAWHTPSIRSAPSAWYSTPSKHCSPAYRIKPCCVPSCGACSDG